MQGTGSKGLTDGRRNASFELMRIICMLMVVMLHYLNGTDRLLTQAAPPDGPRVAGTAAEALCIVAVNAFVLLTGYFLSTSRFRLARLLRLQCEIWFYAILVPAVLAAFGQPVIGADRYDIRYYLLPVLSGTYWFMTAYCIMYLFIPLMNRAAASMSRRGLRTLILLLLIPFCFIKSICPLQLSFDRYGYDFGWFICLYLTGAYCRKYGFGRLKDGRRSAALYLASAAAITLLMILLKGISGRIGGLAHYLTVPFHYNFVLVYAASIGFFALFAHIRIPEGRAAGVIRFLSAHVLAVYLIHGHIDLIDSWEYYLEGIAGPAPAGIGFILHGIFLCMLVLVFSIAADILRGILAAAARRALGGTAPAKKLAAVLAAVDTALNEGGTGRS